MRKLRALLLSTICLASPAGAQFNSRNGIYALNNQTFGLRGNPTIISGGTGYAVNDTITLACPATGTPPVRPVVSVSSVSSGAITGLTVTNAGVSTILPSFDTPDTLNGGCTYTQYSTSGSGSGATFSGVLGFIPGGVFGAGTINAGTTPITGTCTSGQYLYNASGILACQTLSGGGNVSNSGTPVTGQIGIWATSTAIGGTTLGTNVYSALQAALNTTGGLVGYSGALGTPTSGNLANTSGYAASNLTGTTLPAGITTASGLTTVAGGAFASGAFTAAYTCPNATTSALGCAEAGTGLLASGGVFSVAYGTTTGTALQGGGALGTPTSGNASNLTSYLASALASGALPGGATINDGNWFGTVLSVAHGGTGTASPGLIAGTNITSITGTWPNQTINASGGGGGISGPGSVTANDIVTWTNTTTIADSGISLGSQAKGLFLATPSGGSGLPALRAITSADLASITTAAGLTTVAGGAFASGAFTAVGPLATASSVNLATQATGNLPVANLGNGSGASSSTYWRGDGTWATPAGGGNVSNSGTPAVNQLGVWATATTLAGLATANNGVLVTSAGGVPSISTTLPSGLTGYSAGNLTGASLPAAITTASGLTAVAGGTFASGAFAAAQSNAVASDVQAGTSSSLTVTPAALANSAQPQTITYSATPAAWNMASGYNASITLTGNVTSWTNPTNIQVGITYSLQVIQGGSGSYTVSWPTYLSFGAAGSPTLSTTVGKTDVISCIALTTTKLACSAALGY